MSELEIQIYKVDKFEHYVLKSLDKAFKAEVEKAGKECKSGGECSVPFEEHEESCNSPVVENKIFHPHNEVLTEAIEEVLIQVYDDFVDKYKNSVLPCFSTVKIRISI